jgi:hypothetical protein
MIVDCGLRFPYFLFLQHVTENSKLDVTPSVRPFALIPMHRLVILRMCRQIAAGLLQITLL